MRLKKTLQLVACVAGCEAVGLIGSAFTMPSIPGWYASLAKSAVNPPNWVFGPVWTLLFALMGVSLWLMIGSPAAGDAWFSRLWRRLSKRHDPAAAAKKEAIAFFGVQLGLNLLWSAIFFGLHRPDVAFFGILALWLAIYATMRRAENVSRAAAWLLLPYILCVTFAGFLNYSIWQLNADGVPEPLGSAPAIESPLPAGYSAEDYSIAAMTGANCRKSEECQTPMQYQLRSNCPYTSICLKGQCAVVCPGRGK